MPSLLNVAKSRPDIGEKSPSRMSLLLFKYQRARAGGDGNSVEMLEQHFEQIAKLGPTLLPGEPLPERGHSVCLSFDGAFFDFYERVLPLLLKHRLRAVLAVAPSVIRDEANQSKHQRLAVSSVEAYARPHLGAFCTWSELDEIVANNCVAIAAHGYSHIALNDPDADLQTEVHVPHTLLSARLRVPVESFVFPHGHFDRWKLREVRSAYRYALANGDAMNRSWDDRVLYRIGCDDLRSPAAPFRPARLLRYRLLSWWVRGLR